MASADGAMPRKLWEHPDPQNTQMARFMREANRKRGMNMQTFDELYEWSIGPSREDFWRDIWDFASIIHEGSIEQIVEPDVRMDAIPRWFRGVRLNFAENVLFNLNGDGTRGTRGKEDAKLALTEVREGATELRDVSWGALRARVGRLASALHAHGVRRGDRVAVVASNSADTLCVFLATTALGGLFSSSSTDMGARGVLDRLTQIEPAFVFVDDAALYNGRRVDLRARMRELVDGLAAAGARGFRGVVSMPRWSAPADVTDVPRTVSMQDFLRAATTEALQFERVDFSDPFLIVYSSGTTGTPKCIVHCVGGILVSAAKENKIHRDFGPDTVALQYTTTGWIMYLTSVLALLEGARAVLYDGSPFLPDLQAFVRLLAQQRVTNLGISPRWMQTYETANLAPRDIADLSSLRAVTSTGMVLSPQLFSWFYARGFPAHVHLANISGGTDLAGCFGMENALTPVFATGGCQGPSLGTAIAVYDSLIETPASGPPPAGRPVPRGTPGELVAPQSFPNMPVKFWGSSSEDGSGDAAARRRYHDAYFARFDGVWTHGDFVSRDPHTGALLFLGRADGVLNPSGVRFGSAEIYAVIERHFAGRVADSIVVGQRRPRDRDESVMLFLKMCPGVPFSNELVTEVHDAIARECSKRHVPRFTFETPEIPTTVNLKKVELPVKQIVSGHVIKPSGTLLNPGALAYYYRFVEAEAEAEAARRGTEAASSSPKSKL